MAATISHLTAFTILSTAFTISDLAIYPSEVDIGRAISISLLVTNTGNITDSLQLNLDIDNVPVSTRSVTLSGGDSRTVSFITNAGFEGTHVANINGLLGIFTTTPTPIPPPPVQATFTSSSLKVSPTEADTGDIVHISMSVTNTGEVSGSCTAILKINGAVEETKEIEVNAGSSKTVNFTTLQDKAGLYSVEMNGLADLFVVKEEVEVTVSPSSSESSSWLLIGSIIVGVVIVGLIVFFLLRRRAT